MTTADELVTPVSRRWRMPTVRFQALAILPLAVGETPFGCVSLSFVESHDFDPEERAFLLAASQQAAYALNRAQHVRSGAYRVASASASWPRPASFWPAPWTPRRRLTSSRRSRSATSPTGAGSRWSTSAADSTASWSRTPTRPRSSWPASSASSYPVDPRSETGVPNVIRTGNHRALPRGAGRDAGRGCAGRRAPAAPARARTSLGDGRPAARSRPRFRRDHVRRVVT